MQTCLVKSIQLTILLLVFIFSNNINAATTPAFPQFKEFVSINPQKIKPGDIEKITGKKMTLIQKLQFWLIQKKIKRSGDPEKLSQKQKGQAMISMIMGISGFFLLLVPFGVAILAIPLSILAIVFGALSLKGNSNAMGIIGIVTGGITLLLLVLAIIILVAMFSGLRFG